MKINVAKTAGFCFGVNRAIENVFNLLDKGEKVVTLGPIIHNPQMVNYLEERGVRIIEDVSDANSDEVVVIRSHGVPKQIVDNIDNLKIKYEDATCPFVAKIQNIVHKFSKDGYNILIAGDILHPEVIAIRGYCLTNSLVFNDEVNLHEILEDNKEFFENSVIVVAQTTFNLIEWEKCSKIAKNLYTNLIIFDTICNATAQRQIEALEIARQSDLMVVIGGKDSSNTKKLFCVCSQVTDVIHIETASELPLDRIKNSKSIGVTAGASTPAWIIKEVLIKMSETFENEIQEEFNFEEALEQSLKGIYNGEKVTCTVIAVTPTELQVDVGTKHAGYILLSELTDDPNAKIEDLAKVGDQIEVIVTRVNDVDGIVMLSKKRLDARAGYDKIMNAVDTGEIIEGVVVDVIKGGILVLSSGLRVFIPASQATLRRDDPLEGLLKQKVSFKIIEVNEKRRRAVGSIRAVLSEQRKELESKVWENLEIGKTFTGVVKTLMPFGAFVDIGGVDGLVHLSELSWKRIKHPSEVVNAGDTITVYIKDIDQEKKKISLGYKSSDDNPWALFERDYKVDDVVDATIVGFTPFGAFAQIIPGVDALIHISQISKQHVKMPQDFLKIAEVVKAKITEINLEKKRISLSIRALIEDVQEDVVEPATEVLEPVTEEVTETIENTELSE